ncbi:MAG: hypothetical protein FDX02_05950 [Chlorobium sp.]|nr:MAG: hypothetical protein FDX02_05950 [Chlorobium sp.]
MQVNPESEATPAIREKRSLKKGAGLLLSISAISTLCFIILALWVNWPKPRLQPEPLTPALKALVDRIPGNSDALVYIGLKDIRESRLWKEIIPDSLKKAPIFQPQGKLDDILKASKINPTLDIDTLLISFKRHGYKEQNYLGIVSGSFTEKLPASLLRTISTSTETIGGHQCYTLDSTLWLSPLGPRQFALSNNKKMLSEFLTPSGSFFKRDSLSAALIDKAVYKSHLWFALPSAAWTAGALQTLTSTNQGVQSMGNLKRIQNLALSVKFRDGIEGQSEWVYSSNQAAYFASTFLWGAIKLSGLSGNKTTEQTKGLLNRIEVQQNLKSVLIHTELPLELFLAAKQKR